MTTLFPDINKYAADFVRVGIKLLKAVMVGTKNCCIEDSNEYKGQFLCNIACINYYVPCKIKQINFIHSMKQESNSKNTILEEFKCVTF
jgi:hypothetical protein